MITLLALAPGLALSADSPSATPVRILVVGDSLSAEYGIARNSGWVSLLKRELQGTDPSVDVVNASISGDTTAGGLTRFAPLLDRLAPAIVVIELGANDGLRGLPVTMARSNLKKMIDLARSRGG